MNVKRIFVVMALLFVLTVVITGCSSKQQATAGQSGTTAPAPVTSASSTIASLDENSTFDKASSDVLDETDDVTVENSI